MPTRGVVAQRAGDEVERLAVHTPETLIEKVKQNKTSVLRPLFNDFDQPWAAGQYWLDQARRIFNHLLVVKIDDVALDAPVKAFFNVIKEDERTYQPIEVVKADAAYRAQVIAEWKRKLRQLAQDLGTFEEFAGVVDEIDKAL